MKKKIFLLSTVLLFCATSALGVPGVNSDNDAAIGSRVPEPWALKNDVAIGSRVPEPWAIKNDVAIGSRVPEPWAISKSFKA